MITSAQNNTLKLVSRLHRRKYREREGLYLLEGDKMVVTAFKAGAPIERVLVRGEERLPRALAEAAIETLRVHPGLWSRASTTKTPQGILAIVRQQRPTLDALLRPGPLLLLVADGLQDPGNLGTMLRTAAALGFDGAVETEGTVDRFHPRAVRASAANHCFLPGAVAPAGVGAVAVLQQAGVAVVCGDAHAPQDLQPADLAPDRLAVLVGNEGAGVALAVLEQVDRRVRLPMVPGVESLNAAAAFAILAWEAGRHRLSRSPA